MTMVENLKFKMHGNYGGPGYTGGKFTKDGEKGDFTVEPTDKLDEIYRKHDYDYNEMDHGKADKLLIRRLKDYEYENPVNDVKAKATMLAFGLKSLGSAEPSPDEIPEYEWERIKKSEMPKNGKGKKSERREIKAIAKAIKPRLMGPVRKSKKAKVRLPRSLSRAVAVQSREAKPSIVSAAPLQTTANFKTIMKQVTNGLKLITRYPVAQLSPITSDLNGISYMNFAVNPLLFHGSRFFFESILYQRYSCRTRLIFRSTAPSTQSGAFFWLHDPDPTTNNWQQGNVVDLSGVSENNWFEEVPFYKSAVCASKWTDWSKNLWCPTQTYINGQTNDQRLNSAGQWCVGCMTPTNVSQISGDLFIDIEVNFMERATEGVGIDAVFNTAGTSNWWTGGPQFFSRWGTGTGIAGGVLSSNDPNLGFAPLTTNALTFNFRGSFFILMVYDGNTGGTTGITGTNCIVTNIRQAGSTSAGGSSWNASFVQKLTPLNVSATLTFQMNAATGHNRIYIFPMIGTNLSLFTQKPPVNKTLEESIVDVLKNLVMDDPSFKDKKLVLPLEEGVKNGSKEEIKPDLVIGPGKPEGPVEDHDIVLKPLDVYTIAKGFNLEYIEQCRLRLIPVDMSLADWCLINHPTSMQNSQLSYLIGAMTRLYTRQES